MLRRRARKFSTLVGRSVIDMPGLPAEEVGTKVYNVEWAGRSSIVRSGRQTAKYEPSLGKFILWNLQGEAEKPVKLAPRNLNALRCPSPAGAAK
jgi:hypothetical protein